MGSVWKWLLRRFERPNLFGNVAIGVFVLVQILDGVLTYQGVSAWGLDVEGNPIMRFAMSTIGPGFGLALVKLFGTGCGVFLYWYGFYKIVALLVAFYLTIAVFPWAYLFLTS